MNFINNLIFGGRQPNPDNPPNNPNPEGLNRQIDPNHPPNPPNNPAHPSTRGGLPQILDMLRVYPSYFFERPDLEGGNKILLPPRILEQITDDHHGNMPYPLCFSISTLRTKKTVYVGVLEFMAPDDSVVMPFWLFSELKLNEGEMVRLGLVEYLPKANFAKLRPHKTEFIDLPDPRAVLEFHLSNFTCLTKNETITVTHEGKPFQLDILDLKPENQYNAAIIIDTDLNIDFAPPLDYVEPPKQFRKDLDNEIVNDTGEFSAFAGKGLRMDGKQLSRAADEDAKKEKEYDPREHKIPQGIRKEWFGNEFTGTAVKIGK